MKFKTTRNLTLLAILVTVVVIILGAYTRLANAGLGCPDWPTCYGKIIAPMTEQALSEAKAAYPETVEHVTVKKAWLEQVHRKAATLLGAIILLINILAWRDRKRRHPVILPGVLLVLVIFQGILGWWTVSMKLDPRVVMSHLLGGFTVLSLLLCLAIRLAKFNRPFRIPKSLKKTIKPWAIAGLVVLTMQIMLGGWTSANYASHQCAGWDSLPVCNSGWTNQVEKMHLKDAFNVIHLNAEDGNYEFGEHDAEARVAIHAAHRIGAIITILMMIMLIYKVKNTRNNLLKDLGSLMIILLTAQVLLGVGNVVLGLPLLVATAHNIVGAFLLLSVVALNFVLWASKRR